MPLLATPSQRHRVPDVAVRHLKKSECINQVAWPVLEAVVVAKIYIACGCCCCLCLQHERKAGVDRLDGNMLMSVDLAVRWGSRCSSLNWSEAA